MDGTIPTSVWLAVLIVFVPLVAIYFLPSIVAYMRKHKQFVPILIVNLFLGWTLIGWVGALVWATIKEKEYAPRADHRKEQLR
jgi:hypothetical protein